MSSVLKGRSMTRLSSVVSMFNNRLEEERLRRLELIWLIANRLWTDYKAKPTGCEEEVWKGVVGRFTMTDLQTPVARTISSATHGGQVVRRIKKCYNPETKDFVASSCYDEHIRGSFNFEAILYGTSYTVPGFKNDKMCLISLPPATTQIVTRDDDIDEIMAVVADYGSMVRSYESDGVYTGDSIGYNLKRVSDSNFGFLPVAIAKGFKSDALTPYGVDMVWPATQETVQCTYLMNDAMVLERLQSYSTLVIRSNGNGANQPQSMPQNPFNYISLPPGAENDAKYISPDASIDQINDLISSKFERAAVQCQVPVEIFTRSKSGVNQSAGSSYLIHKPLYDLVVSIQEQRRSEELRLIAMIDAMFTWHKHGGTPVDLQAHIDNLDMDISYEREMNPSINQSDAQTWESLVSSRFMTHEKAYLHFNPMGTAEEQQVLEALRESDRSISFNKFEENDAPAEYEDEDDVEESDEKVKNPGSSK